jgi:hypothetical protein
MTTRNEWIEKKVARMLADLRISGFFESGIEDAKCLQLTYGYTWDVALKLSCDYWCDYALRDAMQSA